MDESSEGLAPVIVDHLIGVLKQVSQKGMGLLLVERNLRVALELAENEELRRRYLGVSSGHH